MSRSPRPRLLVECRRPEMRHSPSGPLGDPEPRQQIRFCVTPSGVRVAYATVGRGPALVVPAAWLGHLELAWQDPAVRAFHAPLAAHRTVVRYDKPGCGLSDPWPGRQTLDTDLEVLQAVADHLRLDRFDLLGISMAAPVSGAWSCTAATPTATGSPPPRSPRPCSTWSGRTGGSARTCWQTSSCPTAAPRPRHSSRGCSAAPRRRRSPRSCWRSATSWR